MNPVIKAQVTEFGSTEEMSSLPESELFELYSIYSILNGALGERVDASEAHLAGSEFGVDGVAILVQGRLISNAEEATQAIEGIRNPLIDFYFFQAKSGTSFDYGNMSKFFDSISGFFDDSMKDESDQLNDLMAAKDVLYGRIGRRNPGVHAYYACTGNYDAPGRIERLIGSTKSQWNDLNIFDPQAIMINMVGAKQLQRYYRAASSATETVIDFPRNVVLPTHGSVEEAYLGYLTAAEIVKMVGLSDEDTGEIEDINKAVFFDNVRDFDSDSKINAEIAETLARGEGDDFIFRNNGITVVAKTIDRTGDRFKIQDYQVVNGCQTSHIIFNNRSQAENVNIPFRLIGTKDDDFISSIIAGTNRQNPVREDQFWALRPFMKNFEEYCKSLDDDHKIYFERRENQYRGQKVERARVMQPSILMKAVAATILHQPNRSARDYRGIIAEYQEKLFLDEHDVRPYYASCYLNYRLDYLWRNRKLNSDSKIFKYYIMAGIAKNTYARNNLISQGKNEIEKFHKLIIDLCDNENALKNTAENVGILASKLLEDFDVSTRERLRDTIRSETFVASFDAAIAKLKPLSLSKVT